MSDDESSLLQLNPQYRRQGRMGFNRSRRDEAPGRRMGSSRSRRDEAPGRRAPPKTMDEKKEKSSSDSEESSSESGILVEGSTYGDSLMLAERKKKGGRYRSEMADDGSIDVEASTYEQRMAERRAMSKRIKKGKGSKKQVMTKARGSKQERKPKKSSRQSMWEDAINRF